MKKLYYICCALFLMTFYACSENEDLQPSNLDKNWFIIEDDPSDPVKHLIYQIYTETNTPLFYNDTLGKEILGTDPSGDPVIHYQMLVPNYSINMIDIRYQFVISHDKEKILKALQMLKKEIFDVVPLETMPKSYFIVDSIQFEESIGSIVSVNAYKGMQTFAIGKIGVLKEISEIEHKELIADILILHLSQYIQDHYSKELFAFYALSNDLSNVGDAYDKYIGEVTGIDEDDLDEMDWEEIEELYTQLGFIDISQWFYFTPTKETDLDTYMKKAFMFNEQEFRDIYGNHETIVAKYSIIKTIANKILIQR